MSRLPWLAALTVSLLSTAAGEHRAVVPKDFPANRSYSAGLLVGNTLYVSGQLGQDWRTAKTPDEFEAEVKLCFRNIRAILKEARMDFDDVVSVTVYLTDLEQFAQFNALYKTYFKDPLPVRSTVGVARLLGTSRVEIAVTAHNERAGFMPTRGQRDP